MQVIVKVSEVNFEASACQALIYALGKRASLTEGEKGRRGEQDTDRVICSGTYLLERGWGGRAAGSERHRPGPNAWLSYFRAES